MSIFLLMLVGVVLEMGVMVVMAVAFYFLITHNFSAQRLFSSMPLATLRHAVDLASKEGYPDAELTSVLSEEIKRKMALLTAVDEQLRVAVETGDLNVGQKAMEIVRREGFSADDLKRLKDSEDAVLEMMTLSKSSSTSPSSGTEEERLVESLFSIRALKKVLPRLKTAGEISASDANWKEKEKIVLRAIDALLKGKREAFQRLEV